MNTDIFKPKTTKSGGMRSRMTPALVPGVRKHILLVDADAASQTRRAAMLRDRGVEVTCANDIHHAQLLWQADSYNLVIVDATDVYDSAMAFLKSIKDERPTQRVTFLVGKPGFLADSPLEGEVPAGTERNVSAIRNNRTLLITASDQFSRGTGIMKAAKQISTRRSLDRLHSVDRTVAKSIQELSFGEAIRRAGGE